MKKLLGLILIFTLLFTNSVFADDWDDVFYYSALSQAARARSEAYDANKELEKLKGLLNSNTNNKPSHFIKFRTEDENDEYVDMSNIISVSIRSYGDFFCRRHCVVLKDCFDNNYYSQSYKTKEEVEKIQKDIIDEYNQVLKEYYKNKDKEE